LQTNEKEEEYWNNVDADDGQHKKDAHEGAENTHTYIALQQSVALLNRAQHGLRTDLFLQTRDAPKGKRPKGLLDLLFSKAFLNTL